MPEFRSPRAWYRAAGLLLISSCAGSTGPAATTPANVAAGASAGAAVTTEITRVSVAYRVAADCPDFGAYAAHVSSRSARFALEQRPAPGEGSAEILPSPELSVTIESNGKGGYSGQLSAPEPRPLAREVNGERCADVVEALALITVLRLDAMAEARAAQLEAARAAQLEAARAAQLEAARAAQLEAARAAASSRGAANAGEAAAAAGQATVVGEREAGATPAVGAETTEKPGEAPAIATPSAAETEPVRAEAPEAALEPTDTIEPPGAVELTQATAAAEAPALAPDVPEPAEPEEPERDEEPSTPASSSSSGDSQLRPRVGLFAGYASVPAQALELTLDAELRWGPDRASWATGLAASYAQGNAEGSVGQANLTLLTLQLALCPPGAAFQNQLELRACALFRAGAVDLSASATTAERPIQAIDALRPWAAAGANLELMLPLSPRWSLGVLGEIAVQLVRDRFEVQTLAVDASGTDLVTLYRPELISLELGLGFAYAF